VYVPGVCVHILYFFLHILCITHIKFSSPYCAYHYIFYLAYSTYCAYFAYCTYFLNMYFPGSELSNDKEVPEDMHHQDKPAIANGNKGPNTLQKQPVLPPAAMHHPSFEFHQSIRRLGGNTDTIFKALEQMDAHIPPGPVLVRRKRAGGGVR
jgi:hypothetical protein